MRKKVLLRGPLLTQSGYGHHTRTVLRALRTREDIFDIYLQAVNWGQCSWQWEETEERKWIDETLQKTLNYIGQQGQFDMSLQVTIPNEWEKLAPVNIGITAGIETTKVAPLWIEKSFLMDKIITISEHSKWSYANTKYQAQHPQTGQAFEAKCEVPIDVVHYPVRKFDPVKLDFDLTTDFNFLSVAQWSPRKNIQQLIKCFIEQFKDEENVGLVLKLNIAKNSLVDRTHTLHNIKMFLNNFPERKCKIYVLHGGLTDEEMAGLYTHPKIKAYVTTTHGEGFGLPIFESVYYGLPVIAPDWSGHLDFLYMPKTDKKGNVKNKPMFSRVGYTLQPVDKSSVWDGVIQADSKWAVPEDGSLKMALEDIFSDYGRFNKRAKELQKWVSEEFTEEKQNEKYVNCIVGKSNLKPNSVKGISFCIPTNGKRPEKTSLTISSIQDEMKNFPHEIILCGDVDNFESFDNVKVVDKKEEAHSRKVAVLRNTAAANSKFDTIVWCDDDMILSSGWLEKTLEYSEKNGWNVLGNKIFNPDGTRHWDRGTINPRVLVDYSYPSYNRNLLQTSGFFIIRREVFEKVKWNEERLVYSDRTGDGIPEDLQYSMDLIMSGYQLDFNSEAVVWHNDDSYTEWGNQTLLKDTIRQQTGMTFFPDPCGEFLEYA
jgi:glycosyltransferase involved in cell wall biosynthesis